MSSPPEEPPVFEDPPTFACSGATPMRLTQMCTTSHSHVFSLRRAAQRRESRSQASSSGGEALHVAGDADYPTEREIAVRRHVRCCERGCDTGMIHFGRCPVGQAESGGVPERTVQRSTRWRHQANTSYACFTMMNSILIFPPQISRSRSPLWTSSIDRKRCQGAREGARRVRERV